MRLNQCLAGIAMFSAITCGAAAISAQTVSKIEPSDSEGPVAAPAKAAPAAKSDAWRFKYHNGRWWYWLPSNAWVVYQDRRWVPYDAANFPSATVARRYQSGYRGVEASSEARYWPHGANGSDPTASIHPGAATLHAPRPSGNLSSEHWPHGANGSDTTASSRAGGAAFHTDRNSVSRRYSRSESRQAAEDDYYKWRNN